MMRPGLGQLPRGLAVNVDADQVELGARAGVLRVLDVQALAGRGAGTVGGGELKGVLGPRHSFVEALLARLADLVHVDAVLEAERVGSDLYGEIRGHVLQRGDGRLGQSGDDVSDDLLHALLDDPADGLLSDRDGRPADEHGQPTGHRYQRHGDARFAGEHAQVDDCRVLHGLDRRGRVVQCAGDRASATGQVLHVLVLDLAPVALERVEGFTTSGGQQTLHVLVGKVTVVLDIVGELPESVGHVPVRVFVDVRPVDPDEVKHGVGPIGHGHSHSAKSPRTKLRSLNADANRISFLGREPRSFKFGVRGRAGSCEVKLLTSGARFLAAGRGGEATEGRPVP